MFWNSSVSFRISITKLGFQFVNEAYQVPILTLVFLYMLHTTGELFLSPIGLSMVTKLSPKSMAGTAMGAWFLSFAIANYVGGKIAALTGGHGGGEVTSAEDGLLTIFRHICDYRLCTFSYSCFDFCFE